MKNSQTDFATRDARAVVASAWSVDDVARNSRAKVPGIGPRSNESRRHAVRVIRSRVASQLDESWSAFERVIEVRADFRGSAAAAVAASKFLRRKSYNFKS